MENVDSSAVRKDPSEKVAKPLAPGARAPDFALRAGHDQIVKLSDYKGKPLILVFYPADFSPVCTDELALFNEVLPEFERYGASIVGISVDGIWSHQAFAKSRNLRFPLLSDFEPKGAVSRAYGAYRETDGMSERALFVIDGDGVVRWSYISPLKVNPGADGILKALEDLKAGGERAAATV